MRAMRLLPAAMVLGAAVMSSPGLAQTEDTGRGRAPGAFHRGPTEEEKERSRVRMGITRDQQTQLEAAFEDTGKQMRAIFEGLREKQKKLTELYDVFDVDQSQVRTTMRDILALRRRTMQVHEETEKKVRKILNREQFERMRALMRDESQRRRRSRGPGEAPPPRP